MGLASAFSPAILPMSSALGGLVEEAREILQAAGLKGGLIVHLGSGDGKLTAALRANDSYLVHGLDRDEGDVETARMHVRSLGLYGNVSVDRLVGDRLPYVDNLVNLVVIRDAGCRIRDEEIMRVLAPGGVALFLNRQSKIGNRKWVKPWPDEIDEWTHYLHGPGNNAVAHDSVVGPPCRVQWVGEPKQTRQHEHLASITTVVSSGGRIFSIEDQAPAASILLPPKWFLVARDAFNGVLLWKRPIPSWHPHLWRFRQGPPELGRRLVAVGDKIYVTLGIKAPITCLDAATGEVVGTYAQTKGAEEILVHDGVLLGAIGNPLEEAAAQAALERNVSEALDGLDDWATAQCGNAWDMDKAEDVASKIHVKQVEFDQGVMSFVTEPDPILNLNLGGRQIDGVYNLLAVRMYSSKSGSGQVYYWSPDGDWQGFALRNVRKGWHTYHLDINAANYVGPGGGSEQRKTWGGKSGQINRFRFDPVSGAGAEIKIDWIKLLESTDDARKNLDDITAEKKTLTAIDTATGHLLWERTVVQLMPMTAAIDGGRAFFQSAKEIVCLDLRTGRQQWSHTRPVPIQRDHWSAPTLVVRDDVVLAADRVIDWKPTPSTRKASIGERLRRTRPPGKLIVLSAKTGDELWSTECYEGYNAAVDVFVANGLVWIGKSPGRHSADFTEGRDLDTGEVKRRLDTAGAFTTVHHHRCYRNKATDRYVLLGRTGTEFIDLVAGESRQNHWVRGTCQYGVLPSNGLLYAPPHACSCYIQNKLSGFWALAPARESKSRRGERSKSRKVEESKSKTASRLERGLAYNQPPLPLGEGQGEGLHQTTASQASLKVSPGCLGASLSRRKKGGADDWPTYRRDARRSGCIATPVPTDLDLQWQAHVGGRLTSPVIAGGTVFVASVDAHTVHALHADSGEELWRFTAGGRVDSPPPIYPFVVPPLGGSNEVGNGAGPNQEPPKGGTTNSLCLFGCADGWVYGLRASDGELAWRFRAAPEDRRTVAFGQVESVWPVHGSVLVEDGVLFCAAGRSSYLDGGICFYRLDPATGKMLSEACLFSPDPETGGQKESDVRDMNMAGALPDILSSDGRFVYMRHMRLDSKSMQPVDDFQQMMQSDPAWGRRHSTGHPLYQNPERGPHLFCPTGFLDDSWWHRCYWMYGTFFPACCPYYNAGVFAPAGRILVFDKRSVYGFGRRPQFWGWWTPLEYHLFATDKETKRSQAKLAARKVPENWQGVIRLGTYATRVPYRWRQEVPLHVRAMVLVAPPAGPGTSKDDKIIFVAGPPDVLDELNVDVGELMQSDALARRTLSQAQAAWDGERGARLWAVSAHDGTKLADYELDSLPAWDGMAAANGRLYLATVDGRLYCFAGRR